MTNKEFIFKEYYDKNIKRYHLIKSRDPTIFQIKNLKERREIKIVKTADKFRFNLLPKEILNSKFILLSPIVNDMPIEFIRELHKNSRSTICIDPFNNDDCRFTSGEREFFSQLVKYCDIIKMSKNELLGLFNVKKLNQATSRLKKYNNLFIITLGKQGTLAFQNGRINETSPAIKISKTFDTTGCGDIFFAGFLYALSKSYSIKDCTLLGNVCAGLATTKKGVDSVPSAEKIKRFFSIEKKKL